MTTLAIIPARGGSIGLPRKNLADLGGKPLIAWTIQAALSSRVFDGIVVSTDSAEIAQAAVEAGAQVPFMRPAELATAESSSLDVVNHVLSQCPATSFALLQPTSPFRNAEHIRHVAALISRGGNSSVVSVVAVKPVSWAYYMANDISLSPAVGEPPVDRRQDAPATVAPNGGMYFSRVDHFAERQRFITDTTRGYLMGSIDSIDIDHRDDLEMARAVVQAGLRSIDDN